MPAGVAELARVVRGALPLLASLPARSGMPRNAGAHPSAEGGVDFSSNHTADYDPFIQSQLVSRYHLRSLCGANVVT